MVLHTCRAQKRRKLVSLVVLAGLISALGCDSTGDAEQLPQEPRADDSDSPRAPAPETADDAVDGTRGDAPAAPEPGPDVLEGDLEVYVADLDDGSARTSYELIAPTGARHALSFPAEPSLATGDQVRVQGVSHDDGPFEVQGLSLLNDDDEGTPPYLALTRNATRQTGRVAALLVNWAGPDGVDAASLKTSLFSSTTSAAEFHKEVSYNLNQLEGDVFGWLTIPALANCDTRTLASNAQAAAKAAGIDLSGYGQLAYYFPKTSQCGWSGLATVGRPKAPAKESWYNGSSSCGVLAHELGHNIGAQHAHSYDCGSATLAAPASCTFSEYGDPYDVMGGGQCIHPSTYLKSAEGWFGGCNVVTATSSGSFDLTPVELASDALQGLRIPMDASLCPTGLTSCFYYLEFRQAQGKFDGKTASSPMLQGVLLHVGSAVDFSGNGRPQAPYLLDTTPGSKTSDFQDAPLTPGKTFTDGKGVSITVNSVASSAARVSVSVSVSGGAGAATCIDGSRYGAGTPTPTPDAGTPPVVLVDAGAPRVDAGSPRDAGAPAIDASVADAAIADAGTGTGTGSGEATCPGGGLFAGHCYVAASARSSFDSALASCKSLGAGFSLAEITSAQEDQFVASLIGTNESWLGATDRTREGTWSWLSGRTFWAPTFIFFYGPVNGRYTSFVSGEPNDGGGNSDCLRMVSGGGWRDGNCAETLPSVCER